MGLAPNGKPIYKDLILKHLLDLKPDGTYRCFTRTQMDYLVLENYVLKKWTSRYGMTTAIGKKSLR